MATPGAAINKRSEQPTDMPREESNDVSHEDLPIERSHQSLEPFVLSEKVRRASPPLTVKRNLDVDAVLERSIRKVVGE
jgi:hypothetical protein